MNEKQEMVAVTVDEKDVFTYMGVLDDKPLRKQKLGTVVSRLFTGENVQRHFFVPKDTNSKKKEYSLGPTTDGFQFTDHTEVLAPLLDKGYKLQTVKYSKGGLKIWAMLTPPNPLTLNDPITWDASLWGSGKTIQEAVLITSAIGPGHGIHYKFGWFRIICTNGLIDDILGMGALYYSHTNWSGLGVTKFIENNRLTENVNPVIGNLPGLRRTIQVLDVMEDNEKRNELLPVPIQRTLTPLIRLPNWYRNDLREQFNYMCNQASIEKVTSLDILNAVTSPLNYRNQVQGESRNRQFFTTTKIVTPLAQLIAFMSLLS